MDAGACGVVGEDGTSAPAGPVAVVGLGAMGSRIARRLRASGREVVVWSRTPEKAVPFAGMSAVAVASSPAEAAARAGTVSVRVADPAALSAVTEGPGGIAAATRPGAQVIVMSTVDPAAVTRLAEVLPARVTLLDAPVLGSLAEAEHGRLQIFVGGEAPVVRSARPVLSVLGTLIHVGELGAGSAAKLVANNALLGVLAVLGETVALADSLALPRPAAFHVLATTPLAEQAQRRRDCLDSGQFPTRFRLALARKDADLMLAAAGSAGRELRLLPAVRSWLADAEQHGRGEQDYTAVLAAILDSAAGRRAG